MAIQTHLDKTPSPVPMKSRNHGGGGSSGSRSNWVFWGFAAVAAFFLLTEHRAHVFGALPYLLLFACPLMHLFHHGGHGHHKHHRDDTPEGGSK